MRPAELTGLPLFREPEQQPYRGLPPYQKGSDTSREAARSVARGTPTKRAEVYGYILARGKAGATDAEIEGGPMLRQTVCARRNELVKLGMIRDSERRRNSPQTGRRCAVWGRGERPMTAAQWIALTVVVLCLALLAGLAWAEGSEADEESETREAQ